MGKAKPKASKPKAEPKPAKPKNQAWPADKVERWPLERLQPYPNNARTHSADQIAAIAKSMREFGWTNPALIDEDGMLIAGHARVEAARLNGETHASVMVARGWSTEQKRAYVLADNQLAIFGAGWDPDLLRIELGDLKLANYDLDLIGFADLELVQYMATPGGLDGADPEETPEPPVNPVTRAGDLWLLGNHRLLAGDATKAEDVKRLLDTATAHLVFTDPPYGVGYTGGMKSRKPLAGDHIGTDIYAEALVNLKFAADDKAALYLWYADGHAAAAAAAAAAAGYQIVAQIIWAKNHAQMVTSAHYKGKHEPCFYAHRRGKSARWHGPNNEVTLWECDRSPSNDFHPTQKPVALAQRALGNSSAPGDVVLDMFVGGGTTIIAAEMTARRCFAIEIDPVYVDVALERWEKFTGKKATLEATGQTFVQVQTERYDGDKDVIESVGVARGAIRERKANGGAGWDPGASLAGNGKAARAARAAKPG